MKRKALLLLVILISFGLSFSICSNSFGAEKEITIRYTHQHPPALPYYKGAEKFTKLVEQKSNGRVKFQVYPASQLYKASEIVKAVTSGNIEMGHCVQDEWELVFPLMSILYQPFLTTSPEARREATKGKVGDMIDNHMVKLGAKPMFWMPADYTSAFVNNKRPLRVPKDFEGLLMRTTPGIYQIFEALGAKPVRLNVNDVYMALQRGTVDGSWTVPSSAIGRKWQEVVKYVTIVEMMATYNLAFVNTKFWNNLPGDIQKIMIEASNETEKWVEEIIVQEEAAAIDVLKKKTQTYFPTSQEIDLWKKATRPIVEKYKEQGGPEIKTAVDEMNRINVKLEKK
jgi:tripartite ATP-independent transporter DctP family solute receptor